ncbi:MAG: hypothetical protein DIU62_006560 [Pseudomonadota bacterium]|jgi:ABC-2 type transport system permease protein|nr:MAG: hypothetical protein DIU62_07195 [Pseudomonadota bacterium]
MSLYRHKYALLVRRELWEHRSLFIAPLVAASLLLLTVLLGAGFSAERLVVGLPPPEELREMINGQGLGHIAASTLVGTTVFIGTIAGIAVLFFLLDALYAERKDRSILFWKSMPVSDTETVLAKLAVGLVVVPVGTVLLATALQPVAAAFLYLRMETLRPLMDASLFTGWITGFGRMLLTCVFVGLWYLPVAAWLLLASVVSRRLPMAVAFLPMALIGMFESIAFGRPYVSRVIGLRLLPWDSQAAPLLTPGQDILGVFLDPELWVGLAVGIVMVYIVIRLRRYRDDT